MASPGPPANSSVPSRPVGSASRSWPPPSPVISHPLLVGEPLERRLYQEAIAARCVKHATLVVLPTGLGKTVIALQVILSALDHGKVLFLAPTKPLAEQHYNFLRSRLRSPPEGQEAEAGKEAKTGAKGKGQGAKLLAQTTRTTDGANEDNEAETGPWVSIALFTGSVPPAKREAGYQQARLIVATPQVIENDILQRRLRLNEFSLVIYDEAHRAVGNYAYVFVAEIHRASRSGQRAHKRIAGEDLKDTTDDHGNGANEWEALALGMTASPGSQKEQILQVCSNLGLTHIEKRTDFDTDVIRYIQPIKTHWLTVELPEQLKTIRDELKMASQGAIKQLYGWGLLARPRMVSTKMLLDCGRAIEQRLHASGGQPQAFLFQARSLQAMALKLGHAQEVAETQGLEQLITYFEKLQTELHSGRSSRATKKLSVNPHIKRAARLARESQAVHPKLLRLSRLVEQLFDRQPGGQFIIFANYRVTSDLIVERLATVDGARPVRFVGQGRRVGDKGLTQKEQKEILEAFRRGEHNLLVATSVGEEGLDIPSTDGVIFYEPVPSAIRLIQRRGRTGRNRPGAVYILLTKDSRDEAYYWASRNREKQMRSLLQDGFPAEDLNFEMPTAAELESIIHTSSKSSIDPDQVDGIGVEGSPSKAQQAVPDIVPDPETPADHDPRTEPDPDPVADGEPDGDGTTNEPLMRSTMDLSNDKTKDKTKDASKGVSKNGLKDTTMHASKNGSKNGSKNAFMDSSQLSRSTGAMRPGSVSSSTKDRDAPFVNPQSHSRGQASLGDFEPPKAKTPRDETSDPESPVMEIVIDHREMASGVARELHRRGVPFRARQLPVGDFLVGPRVGVERKTTEDFLGSLVEGKLFGQVRALGAAFPRPLLVLEGTDLFTLRQIDSEAIYGALTTIASDFGLPILSTANDRETAAVLTALLTREARRKQGGKAVPVRSAKPGLGPSERQRYLVEGLPGVSGALAERLLDHFGSVGAIFRTDEASLKEVEGIGPGKAKAIIEALNRPWIGRRPSSPQD